MNYELAKELKEAGFPQEGKGGFIDSAGNEYPPNCIFKEADDVYVPTLEELIEAMKDCSSGFVMEKRFLQPSAFRKTPWAAEAHNNTVNNEWVTTRERGATPTEAVAMLWLALHTKETL